MPQLIFQLLTPICAMLKQFKLDGMNGFSLISLIISTCALSRENQVLLSRFLAKLDSNQFAQLQRLARILKYYVKQVWLLYFSEIEKNKGADQTVRMRKLFCAFVFCMQQNQFSR